MANAIYYRYGQLCQLEFSSAEDAKYYLQQGEDQCSLSSVGVVNYNVLYVPIITLDGFGRETLRSMDDVCKVYESFDPVDVRHYYRFPQHDE